MTQQNKAIIIADGEFTKVEILKPYLNGDYFVACTDGAIYNLVIRQITPNLIIGDLDSINDDLKEKFKDILIEDKDQNTNDLTKAFNYLKDKGFKEITIFAATGYREDHTLANISLLMEYAKYDDIDVTMISNYGNFKVYQTPCTIEAKIGEPISLFSFDPYAKFSSENLKYKLDNMQLSLLYMATLNEPVKNSFSITSDNKAKILIYRAFEKIKKKHLT